MRMITAKKNVYGLAILLALILMTGNVSAQSTQWDGFYLGASLGGENSNVCSTSTLNGLSIDPTTTTFSRCSSGGLVGGLQFGETFQMKRLVLGLGVDLVFSEAKSNSSTLDLTGVAPPPGTYSLS